MPYPSLKNKVALVTGGNTGIGKCIVRRFAEEGSNVVIGYFQPDGVDDIVSRVRGHGVEALAVEVDIRNRDQVSRIMNEICLRFGGLNFLICNAAAQYCKPFLDMGAYETDEIIDTNITGTINCIQWGSWLMLQKPSEMHSVIGISSINAPRAQEGLEIYGMTKVAIEALVTSLSVPLGSKGIRINGIRPGSTATERTLQISNYHAWAEVIPTGRITEPEDIAGLAAFLCSSDAAQITGVTVAVDGGQANTRHRPDAVGRG